MNAAKDYFEKENALIRLLVLLTCLNIKSAGEHLLMSDARLSTYLHRRGYQFPDVGG
jgi:hypothetical protein